MPQENFRQLHDQLRKAQDKYVYFLLAVAASAIAFSVQITKDSTFEYSLIPLGIAVMFWGTSFFCGCRNIQYVNNIIYSNAEFLKIKSGIHPEVGPNPGYISAASQGIMEAIKSNQDSASSFGKWQFRFIVLGGLSFVCWHLTEMALRTLYQ